MSVDSTTATSISLSWSVPSGSLVHRYVVMWERDTSAGECPDDVDQDSTTITDGSTSHTIMELEEDSTYIITVRASNAIGSAVSDSGSGVTREAGKQLYIQSRDGLQCYFQGTQDSKVFWIQRATFVRSCAPLINFVRT